MIPLDFATSDAATPEALAAFLLKKLEITARSLGVKLDCGQSPSIAFEDLIRKTAGDGNLVIRIDEYDKPVLGNVNTPRLHEILRVLKGFYSVVKGAVFSEAPGF